MSKSLADLALHDEQILTDELPDAALEVAASQMYSGNPYTLAFCTGFSSCPFGAADGRYFAKLPELLRKSFVSTASTLFDVCKGLPEEVRAAGSNCKKPRLRASMLPKW
jgi:hypothetical protein